MKTPDEILQAFEASLLTVADKKQQVLRILDFTIIYGDSYGDRLRPILENGIRLSEEIGFEAGRIICHYNLLFYIVRQGTVHAGHVSGLSESIEMVDKLKDEPELYVLGLHLVAYFYWFSGEYEKAFNAVFECLRLAEGNPGTTKGWSYFALAVFYFDTKDYENSLVNYKKAYEIFDVEKYAYGRARAMNGMGTVAILQKRLDEAFPLLESAAEIYRSLGHHSGLSRAVNDMGLLEKTRGKYEQAIGYLKESIRLRDEIGHYQGLITSQTELGETYLQMKKFEPARQHFKLGLELAVKIKTRQKQMRLHKLLYDTYKELNNTGLALLNFEKFFELKTELLGDEAANNIRKLQSGFEKEKSEKQAEIERLKNVELKKANAVIEQKNKDITDSINYAKRIQSAILPGKALLDKHFSDYFVLFMPKDIVSGDFYWAATARQAGGKEELPVIAAVDCTGHGVPGAFMSMLGNTLLNQTIFNPTVSGAAEILNYLNTRLPENLKSSEKDQSIRDGMDMSLCIFDFRNLKLQFAGANNPCWIMRNSEMIELKGDKQAISAGTDFEKKKFTNHHFDLKKNDWVYLFTDGYADQFGGPNEKKFNYKRFKELLIANSGKSPEEQKRILLAEFENWRRELEQIDDVCVIGIRV